jgi:hypothetical protein
MSSLFQSIYSLILTTNSQMYSRDCNEENFYYEAFQVNVPESRTYTIWSSSEIDPYGFIYENRFDSLNPTENFIASDNDYDGRGLQFKFEIPLYADTTYVLVVTTFRPKDIGNITINLLGLTNVTIKHVSE